MTPTQTFEVISFILNFAILLFNFKIKADIAELKVYMHKNFQEKHR